MATVVPKSAETKKSLHASPISKQTSPGSSVDVPKTSPAKIISDIAKASKTPVKQSPETSKVSASPKSAQLSPRNSVNSNQTKTLDSTPKLVRTPSAKQISPPAKVNSMNSGKSSSPTSVKPIEISTTPKPEIDKMYYAGDSKLNGCTSPTINKPGKAGEDPEASTVPESSSEPVIKAKLVSEDGPSILEGKTKFEPEKEIKDETLSQENGNNLKNVVQNFGNSSSKTEDVTVTDVVKQLDSVTISEKENLDSSSTVNATVKEVAKSDETAFTTEQIESKSTPKSSPQSTLSGPSKDSSIAETVIVSDPKPEDESTETEPGEVTKQSIRLKIWDHLDKNGLVRFPRPCKGRIPNFEGAPDAADQLAKLDIFKNSKVIRVNPDKPQELTRIHTLERGKRLLVPVPRLRTGLLQAVIPPADANHYLLRTASQRFGMQRWSKPVRLDDNIHIDLVILGSVAVDKKGHRIGKGEGFGDLEFALMVETHAISDETVIITTVHDDQVVDDMADELFKEHDVPVDWIITPTRIIEVEPKLPRPKGIIWNILSNRRILELPLVQQLRERQLSDGKECDLKEVDSEPEDNGYMAPAPYRQNNYHRRRFNYSRSTGDPIRDGILPPSMHRMSRPLPHAPQMQSSRNIVNSNRYMNNRSNYYRQEPPMRRPYRQQSRRRAPLYPRDSSISMDRSVDRRSIQQPPPSSPPNELATKSVEVQTQKKNRLVVKRKAPIAFSVRVRNIEPGVRVRDLKTVLNERGIKPRDITWRGYKGTALLHFVKVSKKVENSPTVEDIIKTMQGITLKPVPIENPPERYLIVEPAKPKVAEIIDTTANPPSV